MDKWMLPVVVYHGKRLSDLVQMLFVPASRLRGAARLKVYVMLPIEQITTQSRCCTTTSSLFVPTIHSSLAIVVDHRPPLSSTRDTAATREIPRYVLSRDFRLSMLVTSLPNTSPARGARVPHYSASGSLPGVERRRVTASPCRCPRFTAGSVSHDFPRYTTGSFSLSIVLH